MIFLLPLSVILMAVLLIGTDAVCRSLWDCILVFTEYLYEEENDE